MENFFFTVEPDKSLGPKNDPNREETDSMINYAPEIRNELGEICVYEKICVYKSVFVYKCGKCTKLYSTIESLKTHFTYCSTSPKFSCDHCDYKTYRKVTLKIHLKYQHPFGVSDDEDSAPTKRPRKRFFCEQCWYKTHRQDYLEHHVKLRHPSIDSYLEPNKPKPYRHKFACDKCDFKTYRGDYLDLHMEAKHLLTPLTFSRNDKKKNSEKQVLRKPQNFKFFCEKCRFKTEKEVYLERHVKLKHPHGDANQPKVWPKLMPRPDYLEVQFQVQNIGCKHCEFKTHDDKVLASHVRQTHPELLTCFTCNKVFVSPGGLKTHLRNLRCKA